MTTNTPEGRDYHTRRSIEDSGLIAGACLIACVVLMVLASLGLTGGAS